MTVLMDQINQRIDARDRGIVEGVITTLLSLGHSKEDVSLMAYSVLHYEFEWSHGRAIIEVESHLD